jgi:hypothetical protein
MGSALEHLMARDDLRFGCSIPEAISRLSSLNLSQFNRRINILPIGPAAQAYVYRWIIH